MDRRGFTLGMLGAGAALVGCRLLRPPPVVAIDDHEREVLAAIAETFLPGGDGAPGAREVDALAAITSPEHELHRYLGKVVDDLDGWCLSTRGKGFLGLGPPARTRALEQRLGLHGTLIRSLYHEAYAGILLLTKLAYFGALANPFGTSYLGFPTASRGYAPGSAAGAWASRDRPWPLARGAASRIEIEGGGVVTSVRLSAFAIGDDLRATLRLVTPDRAHRELAVATRDGEGWLIHVDVPLVGGPAAGAWTLAVAEHTGAGMLAHWSLVVRTDLDDRRHA